MCFLFLVKHNRRPYDGGMGLTTYGQFVNSLNIPEVEVFEWAGDVCRKRDNNIEKFE